MQDFILSTLHHCHIVLEFTFPSTFHAYASFAPLPLPMGPLLNKTSLLQYKHSDPDSQPGN
jgi:hypothetical protein